MELIDVHAHLTDERFRDDLTSVIKNANESGVKTIVCSAFDLQSSFDALKISKSYENVYATVGIHPENVDEKTFSSDIKKLLELAKERKVVAVGEIGLDYHYTSENKELQKQIFVEQLKLANQLSKLVVIHSRDAMGDTIEILKNNPLKRESLLHCYSGSIESAKILMNLGFSFSFGGVVTFPNAKNVRDVVKFLPIERILLETDCPYLAPMPYRGKRNEPKNVVYVADMISKIKDMSFEEVLKKTTQNAKRLFEI